MIEVDVLDFQLDHFHEPHAGCVEDLHYGPVPVAEHGGRVGHVQQSFDLPGRWHGLGKALRFPGMFDFGGRVVRHVAGALEIPEQAVEHDQVQVLSGHGIRPALGVQEGEDVLLVVQQKRGRHVRPLLYAPAFGERLEAPDERPIPVHGGLGPIKALQVGQVKFGEVIGVHLSCSRGWVCK